jgi:hypothetical protein
MRVNPNSLFFRAAALATIPVAAGALALSFHAKSSREGRDPAVFAVSKPDIHCEPKYPFEWKPIPDGLGPIDFKRLLPGVSYSHLEDGAIGDFDCTPGIPGEKIGASRVSVLVAMRAIDCVPYKLTDGEPAVSGRDYEHVTLFCPGPLVDDAPYSQDPNFPNSEQMIGFQPDVLNNHMSAEVSG